MTVFDWKPTRMQDTNSANHPLLKQLDRLHTTELGAMRIKRNLRLTVEDAAAWCREQIASPSASIRRQGKNWYVHTADCVITVNAASGTIITAHPLKKDNGGSAPAANQKRSPVHGSE